MKPEAAITLVLEAVRKARAQGIRVAVGELGVRYDPATGGPTPRRASGPVSPLGALLLAAQPRSTSSHLEAYREALPGSTPAQVEALLRGINGEPHTFTAAYPWQQAGQAVAHALSGPTPRRIRSRSRT